jgi:hypothetical protein
MDLIEAFSDVSELMSDIFISDENLLKSLPKTLDFAPDVDDFIDQGEVLVPGLAVGFH